MITLDITPEEKQILAETLDITISDLSMEISHTDQLDYREILKKRKMALNKVRQTLQ